MLTGDPKKYIDPETLETICHFRIEPTKEGDFTLVICTSDGRDTIYDTNISDVRRDTVRAAIKQLLRENDIDQIF
jgi:hypothetical protein